MQPENTPMKQAHSIIYVIGTDASGLDNIPIAHEKLILSSKRLAAPRRILDQFPEWWLSKSKIKKLPDLFESNNPNELIDWLQRGNDDAVLLASGDPLWFGIGRQLIENFPKERLRFQPSLSSFQIAFARLAIPWQEASWISLHGRDPSPLANLLQQRPKALVILTDPSKEGVEEVRQFVRASGLEENYAFWVCERLGHINEKIHELLPKEETPNIIDPLNLIVLLEKEKAKISPKNLPLFGIDDGEYIQYVDKPGLMTKREVRVQLLADLELPENGVIWDIGAGVGSIGLEALRIRPKLQLVCIDKRLGSANLIKKNANYLNVYPAKVLEDDATKAIESLKIPELLRSPDRVILGGGGEQKELLLNLILNNLKPNGIVVIPIVSIDYLASIIEFLNQTECQLRISQHQNWRGIPLAKSTRLSPLNPVFIIQCKYK